MPKKVEAVFAEVNAEIKTENANRLYRIVLLAQAYADNKKVLKYIEKVVKIEENCFKNPRFPMKDTFNGYVKMWIEETRRGIKLLRMANTVEKYSVAKEGLKRLIIDLGKELGEGNRFRSELELIQAEDEKVETFEDDPKSIRKGA